MRERWGQEEEWSEKRRQMMLFQDHGGLIMMVPLHSLLTCFGSLFFLSIFFRLLLLVLLTGPIGHGGCKQSEKLLIYDLLRLFSRKKWQSLAGKTFYRSSRDKYTLLTAHECSCTHTHTHTKDQSQTKNERHLCRSTKSWQTSTGNPEQRSVDLWRPQRLPITWQR